MIAALFVQATGVYAGRPDVETWDVSRDARTYPGPWPVVAHPPCARWGPLSTLHPGRGEDEGCFAAALDALDRWGGVLEHPAGSFAWPTFGLPRPGGWGWTPGRTTGDRAWWTCTVEQGNYGHVAPKRTVLLLVTRPGRGAPPALRWGPSGAPGRVLRMWAKRDREATPPAFADVLLDLARWSTGDASSYPATGDEDQVADRCPVCAGPVVQARYGPRRRLCSDACKQRASRQARAAG